jgi:predicted glycosyltransferase
VTRAGGDLRRVLLYSHDTYGLGHLRRNLAIADHLLARHAQLQVVLMTGSSVAERFTTPARLKVVQLPPVIKVGDEDYRSRDPRWSTDLVRRSRSAIMTDTARRFRPDVFLVDHAPQGLKKELLPVFDVVRATSPHTRIVLGLRDVIDTPAVVRAHWSQAGVYETLERVVDRILVYGSAELYDATSLYGLSDAVASKVTYCGYVSRRDYVATSPATDGDDVVLGIAGGGGDGAEVLAATLTASAALGRRCVVMTGPLMSDADRRALEQQVATHPDATIVEFVADPSEMMRRARVVVSMGGYNSLCELVALHAATIVVPRIAPRREQAIRANIFAQLGVVSVVAPGEDLATRLRETLRRVLEEDRVRPPSTLDLAGLVRVEAALHEEARAGRDHGALRRDAHATSRGAR